MTLNILTPEKTLFSGNISSVSVPAVPGILTILPKHTHLTSNLQAGEVKVVTDSNSTLFFSIGEGFLSVTPNETTVLVTKASNSEELDEIAILNAKKQAEESLKQKPTGADLLAQEAIIRKSIVDLKLLRKRKS